jgi:O-methyltransferase involved in polyketide biosynthesis
MTTGSQLQEGLEQQRGVWMEQPSKSLEQDDSEPWTTAGIRDCWLGGSHHTAAEYDLAERILVGTPYLPYLVRVYRALLRRLVNYLAGVGIRQFVDLGSGLPTQGNVHEVAQATGPGCHVIYVDNNPQVVARSQRLLSGNNEAVMVCADLRHPEQVLSAATQTGLLDLSAPVAVLLIDILHHVSDADNPAAFIQTYIDALPQDSYVAIAHTDDERRDFETGFAMFRKLYQRLAPPLTFRDPKQIADLLESLNIVEPGVVPIPLWHPEAGDDLDIAPEQFPAWCGVGRKP